MGHFSWRRYKSISSNRLGTGISNTEQLDTGDGDDIITGTGIGGIGGVGITGYIFNGDGIGIANSGSLNTGKGNDQITGTGSSPRIESFINYDNIGIGIINSKTLDTADGDDIITGKGTGPGQYLFEDRGYGTGIQNTKDATITTGKGNDTITGSGDIVRPITNPLFSISTTARGIFNDGLIDTGKGRDILTGQATAITGDTAYGIYGQGTIQTGDGNDKVTATSTINEVQQKVTIGGGIKIELGTGNDYLKGFGTGSVDGGSGWDTLDLGQFNYAELIISGVTSGDALNRANISFNNNGNVITLSTVGFENFIFADTTLSYSTLV